MATVYHLGFSNFSLLIGFEELVCTVMQNYIKSGNTAADISHFSFFKMTDEQLVCNRGLCVIIQNFVKLGQRVWEILRFFLFLRGPQPSSWANVHRHAKFYRNQLNSCAVTAFNIFTARRLAKRGICHRRVSVCLSVCVCVCP